MTTPENRDQYLPYFTPDDELELRANLGVSLAGCQSPKKIKKAIAAAVRFARAQEQLRLIHTHQQVANRTVAFNQRGIQAPAYLHPQEILSRLGMEYDPVYPHPPVPENEQKEMAMVLKIIPETERAELLEELGRKCQEARGNYSDYHTPGISGTRLNKELGGIWRDVEDIFYTTLDRHLIPPRDFTSQ